MLLRVIVAIIAFLVLQPVHNAAQAAEKVAVVFHFERTGCARLEPHKPFYISVWRATQYPGDGTPMPADEPVSGNLKSVMLPPGYYRVLYTAERCVEEFHRFVVLRGHPRNISIRYAWDVSVPPKKLPNGETIITISDPAPSDAGALAGTMGANVYGIQIMSPDRKNSWKPKTGNGAYYFDYVEVGRYGLSYFDKTGRHSRNVSVKRDHLLIIDL